MLTNAQKNNFKTSLQKTNKDFALVKTVHHNVYRHILGINFLE